MESIWCIKTFTDITVPVCFIILNMKFNKCKRNLKAVPVVKVLGKFLSHLGKHWTRQDWLLCLGRGQMEMSVTKFPFVLRKKNKSSDIMGELPHPCTLYSVVDPHPVDLWIRIRDSELRIQKRVRCPDPDPYYSSKIRRNFRKKFKIL